MSGVQRPLQSSIKDPSTRLLFQQGSGNPGWLEALCPLSCSAVYSDAFEVLCISFGYAAQAQRVFTRDIRPHVLSLQMPIRRLIQEQSLLSCPTSIWPGQFTAQALLL